MPSPAAVPTDVIPLVDLAAQYRAIKHDVDQAVQRVVERGDFTLGEEVARFEADFARFCGVAHGIGLASGTDALHLALRALGVGPGDEVIVPAMTFAATAEAVIYCGATPVFADVYADSLLLDAASVEAAITPRTKGVIPVHLYGQSVDVDALRTVCDQHGIWVLEDAAQAQGTTWKGKRAGSFGVAGCFSFYPSKNLGAFGDAGMVVTSDPAIADKIKVLRHHGQRQTYRHEAVGYCARLDNLQAAVLGAKLPYLEGWNEARRGAAERYDRLIGNRVERVGRNTRAGSIHYVYVVRVAADVRDGVVQRLKGRGVGAGLHYPVPLNQVPAFVEMGLGGTSCPQSEAAAREVLSLPLYPEITAAQQERVVDELFAALSSL